MTSRTVVLDMRIADVPNSNDRHHWAVEAAQSRAIKERTRALARQLPPLEPPVELALLFTWPDRRRRDLDNVSVKPLIDGLVAGGVIPDDDASTLRRVSREVDLEHKAAAKHVIISATLRPYVVAVD